MRKRIAISILLILVIIFMLGCSSEEVEKGSGKDLNVDGNIDSKFIKDFDKVTKTRWDMVKKSEEKEKELGDEYDHDMYLEDITKFVEVETESLYEYRDSEFDDAKLGKLAKEYIDGLEMQEQSYRILFCRL